MQSIIDEYFSKDTVEEIIKSFVSWLNFVIFSKKYKELKMWINAKWYVAVQETEAGKEGNGWIGPVLKGLKRSSPTGLKITLKSVTQSYNMIQRQITQFQIDCFFDVFHLFSFSHVLDPGRQEANTWWLFEEGISTNH